MKKFLPLTATIIFLCAGIAGRAQCPTGYTTASLNWDNLDFLNQDATYITAAQAQTQYFAFGSNRVTITHNYAMANAVGENAVNTGETGSYGIGEDVQFTGDGTITISFQTAVQNVKFSVYDIDANQTVTITSLNGATPQPVTTLSRINGTYLTIAGSGTNSASATAGAGFVDNTSTDGSINVSLSGPVTSVTLTITTSGTVITPLKGNKTQIDEDGSFWLSDISACTNTTAFPTSYYAISKPFTNQPGYVLAAIDDSVIMVDPANGKSKLLFKDPTGNNINSVGYDPYNKFLYYTYSLTGSGGNVNPNDKAVQKYDVNTGTISTIISNVNTLGIPTYTSGVESGGAAFYNGAFYIGIEGIDGEESKIWRIDFDALFNPISPARQVYSVPTVNHDWSDFAISNGMLYDFNGKSSGSATHYESIDHVNLWTGAKAASYNYATMGFVPRQVSMDWTEKLFNMGTAATTSTGTIVPYANGTITTAQQYNITMGTVTPSGSWGDAAEAFKPKADFGDAPASYDPDPQAPAMHEIDANLRLGNTEDVEWNKSNVLGTNADVDGSDEDGLTFVRIMNMRSGSYQTDVNVYNNTGAAATIAAWADFNGDGVFQSTEGVVQTVPTGTGTQSVSLYWSGIPSFLADNSHTYLRIRISSSPMTKNDPTGYFGNGEVEDYYVLVNVMPLDVTLKSFSAKKVTDNKVKLTWNIVDEKANTTYELQKSANGADWQPIYKNTAAKDNVEVTYTYDDINSTQPQLYYRLHLSAPYKTDAFSAVQKIVFVGQNHLSLSPNPAAGPCKLEISSLVKEAAQISLIDVSGKAVYTTSYNLEKGANTILLPTQNLHEGVFTLRVVTASTYDTGKLVVQKK